MKQTYEKIIRLLKSDLGGRLGMQTSNIQYSVQDDPGKPVPGNTTKGRWENIIIPDEYMNKAGVNSADDFLAWLQRQ